MKDEIVNKILEALGYDTSPTSVSDQLEAERKRVEVAVCRLKEKAKSRVLFKVLEMCNLEQRKFIDEKILLGQSVRQFLGQPDKVIICATTLGTQVDQLIRMEGVLSISNAVLIDTAAMEVIEDNLNEWVRTLKKEHFDGAYLSPRFSPGYGDMPLTMQKDILKELQCQKQIGLTVSDSGILLPKKSVTAVIGVYDRPFETHYSNCDSCLIRTVCKKRERGDYCGY